MQIDLNLSISSLCSSFRVCLPQCMLGYHTPPRSRHPQPPGGDTPREQTPPWEQTHPRSRHTPQTAWTPQSRYPREQTPPPPRADTPPGTDTPPEQTPPRAADSGIRSMSGRYASYWNAFFFFKCVWWSFKQK